MGLALLALPIDERRALSGSGIRFVLPLFSTVVELISGGDTLVVDRTTWATLPPRQDASLRAMTLSARVLTLEVSEGLVEEMVEIYAPLEVTRQRVEKFLAARAQILPRTVWVHEVSHRYLFERQVLNALDNQATRFLETELLKEAFFLCRDRERGEERAPLVHGHGPVVKRALAYIEVHLFESERVDKLAKHCGASESTLLRAFKRELGSTPGAYWRSRRLDEALALLRTGEQSVSEIALHVGYENPAAFSQAFQLRFGQPPSAFLSRGKRRAPPCA